jgi:hypothetical protein
MAAATLTTIAIGAAIGAGVGAVATYASGGRGDALWKGALVGAVSGAVTGGVGSWAGSAGGLALSSTAAGALGGAAGGVTAGALGTALSGGTGQDYLKNILTGGVTGTALGAAGGYLQSGTEAGVNPVTGEAAPTGSPTITADPNAPSGLTTGDAASSVQQSISGPTASTTSGLNIDPNAGTVSNAGQTTTYNMTGQTFPTESATAPWANTYAANADAVAKDLTSLQGGGLNINPDTGTVSDGGLSTTYNKVGTYPTESVDSQNFKNWEEMTNKTAADLYKTQSTPTVAPTTTGTGTKMGLEDYLKMQGKAQLMGGGIKALGALATAPETQQNKQALMDLYNQQQDQNQYYQNLMRGTYENPQGYLGSPEAAATRSAALQKILAANAAAGRRTAGSAAYNQLMMNQLQNLGAYRQGMPRPSYGTALQTLQGAQQYSPTADIFGGLASMATPLSLYSLYA